MCSLIKLSRRRRESPFLPVDAQANSYSPRLRYAGRSALFTAFAFHREAMPLQNANDV